MAAAISVINAQGLSAATAKIASAAGVSNGSLFTYFETKSALLNAVYLAIKAEMAEDLLTGVEPGAPLETCLQQAWANWMDWGAANRAKRNVMAQLTVSSEISAQTRREGDALASDFKVFFARIKAHGHLRHVPEAFAMQLISTVIEACMDAIAADPAQAPALRAAGFSSFWRMIQ